MQKILFAAGLIVTVMFPPQIVSASGDVEPPEFEIPIQGRIQKVSPVLEEFVTFLSGTEEQTVSVGEPASVENLRTRMAAVDATTRVALILRPASGSGAGPWLLSNQTAVRASPGFDIQSLTRKTGALSGKEMPNLKGNFILTYRTPLEVLEQHATVASTPGVRAAEPQTLHRRAKMPAGQ